MALEFTAALFVRAFVAQPFTIPSGSMIPTLEVGDYVVASKFSYGYSNYSLPFGQMLPEFAFARTEPRRGDVVIFKQPANPSVDYVMRVIGLPGDEVQVKSGVTFINGAPLRQTATGAYQGTTEGYSGAIVSEEALPDDRRHSIMDTGDFPRGDDTPVFKVPEDHYFVMGDNRDNSNDSRFDLGFVPAANIYAKALVAITWPDGQFTMRDIK